MRYLPVVVVVARLVSGCHREDRHAAPSGPTTNVGWTIDAPGELVRAGNLMTDPPGDEVKLVPAIPEATRRWVRACKADGAMAQAQPGVRLELTVTAAGAIHAARRGAPDRVTDCLAAKAVADHLDVHLPGDRAVAIELTLAAGS